MFDGVQTCTHIYEGESRGNVARCHQEGLVEPSSTDNYWGNVGQHLEGEKHGEIPWRQIPDPNHLSAGCGRGTCMSADVNL